MKNHFVKRVKRNLLGAQTVQEILERLDIAYKRFFEHLATRPPKFRKAKDFASIVYKQNGFSLCGNEIAISKIHKSYKFSKSNSENNLVCFELEPTTIYIICFANIIVAGYLTYKGIKILTRHE